MHRPCSTDSQTRCWPSPRGAAAGDVIHTRVSPTPIHPRSHQSDHLRFSLPMIHWKAHSRPSLIWAHQEKLSLGWLVYPVWAAHDFFFLFAKGNVALVPKRANPTQPTSATVTRRPRAYFSFEKYLCLSPSDANTICFLAKSFPIKKFYLPRTSSVSRTNCTVVFCVIRLCICFDDILH